MRSVASFLSAGNATSHVWPLGALAELIDKCVYEAERCNFERRGESRFRSIFFVSTRRNARLTRAFALART